VRRTFWRLLFLAGALAVCAGLAWCEAEDEGPVFEVEVIGFRDPDDPGTAPASVSVITETEIERSGSRNLMDLLVREPGVWVARQGGLGFGGNVSIRGFGGSPPTQLAVLLDGHPTQMGIMGHILPTSYLLDNVRRVEIMRGPAGALHGHMALGGVINIATRGPNDEEDNGAFSATRGSFNTWSAQLWAREANDRSGYRFQLGRLNTNGDHPFARYDGENYSLAVDHRLGGNWDLAFRSQRLLYTTFDQREVANAFAEGREPNFIAQDYDRGDYDLELTHKEGDRRTTIKLYRTEGDHEFDDGFHSQDCGQGLMLSQRSPVGRGRALWGIDYGGYGGDIFGPPQLARSFSRRESAFYFILDHPVGRECQLSGGFRHVDTEDFDVEILPLLGITRPLAHEWTLFAGARRGYRVPSFRELFLFGINNPDLEPEAGWQYEVGARKLLADGGQFEVSLFRIDADNLILLRPRPSDAPPGLPVQWANAGAAVREGLEIGLRKPVGVNTAVYANFSYLNPGEIREQTVGRKLAGGLDHRLGRWLLSADLQYIDRLFDFDHTNTLVEVPAFTVLNLKASRNLAPRWRLGIVVENLFDREYRVDPAYPFPMPGRSVRVDARRSW